MLIVCPSCATSYTVQPTSLPPHGQVRCLRCCTVWSPLRNQADKLLAAAAAIADDFAALPDPHPGEESPNQTQDSWDVAAPYSEPEPAVAAETEVANPESDCSAVGGCADPEADWLIAAEIPAANPDPDSFLSVAEEVAANPEARSSLIAEIVFVDLEPDRPLVVADDAVANPEAETGAVPEVITEDSLSDDAAGSNIALMQSVSAEGQLHASASEAPALDQDIGIAAHGEWLSDHLIAEVTEDESSFGDAVDLFEEEPPANSVDAAAADEKTDISALQFGAEACSDDIKISAEHETAPSEQADRGDGKQPIDLRAVPENAELIERRTASRSQREAKVRTRGLNIPPRRFAPRWPLSNLHTGILALALLDVFLVGWRTDIVRKLPQTASFYALAGLPVNLRGLAFDAISTRTVRDDGTPVLVVEGNIINDTRKNVRVPQIRFVVRDAAAQEIYSWTASAARTSLPPGQAATFRTRLASPPPGAHDVVLRFVSRHDAVAVIR
jgi:predicted Zn finger-like uncharacterized protein